MSFIETRFPRDYSYGAAGGPRFNTFIAGQRNGQEKRNSAWPAGRHVYDVSRVVVGESAMRDTLDFFWAMGGRELAFRFWDWKDYTVSETQGILGDRGVAQPVFIGTGSGVPAYQLWKKYSVSTAARYRPIQKPVSGTTAVKRDGVAVTVGSSAGQISIDATTGLVTFVADATAIVTGVTVGATTAVTLSSAIAGLSVGRRLYLSGIVGTASTALNGVAHQITSISTNTYTLDVSTVGTAYTSGGIGGKYPQADEALIFSNEFDVPVRFDADELQAIVEARSGNSYVHRFASVPLLEVGV